MALAVRGDKLFHVLAQSCASCVCAVGVWPHVERVCRCPDLGTAAIAAQLVVDTKHIAPVASSYSVEVRDAPST